MRFTAGSGDRLSWSAADTIMQGAYLEILFVLAFAIGWAVLEFVCRRLDRKREEDRARDTGRAPPSANDEASPPA